MIFDMDGVIALTEQAHWQSWCVAAEARGVHLQYDTFLSCFGRINADCVAILFGPDVSPEESDRIAEEKEIAFRDIVRKSVPLAPGLVPLLEGIAWPRNQTCRWIVGAIGKREPHPRLGRHPSIFRCDRPRRRSHSRQARPDVFLLAAERLGVPAARCTVIEDAPAGIRAAVAAEMMPVAVATTHDTEELEDAGAIAVFADLKSDSD